MQGQRARRHFLAHVVLPVALTVTVTAAILAALLAWSTYAVDRVATQRQSALFSVVLRDSIRGLAHDQEASTVWNDAVEQLRRTPPDPTWLDANLGVWFNTYYGHDQVYIVDPRDRPIYAMRGGRRVAAGAFGQIDAVASPLIRALRGDLRYARAPRDRSTLSAGAADLGMVLGRPAIISVKPIVPETAAVRQAPGTEYLHISIRFLDGGFLRRLADQYWFDGARFSATGVITPRETAMPLRTRDGQLLGFVVWRPFVPGANVLAQLGPALAIGLLVIGLILAWLMMRIRRGNMQLQSSRAQAEHLAFHDTLTGLPNRALFDDRLTQELARVRRGEGRAALLFLDLDRFKHVNDTYGHPAGDELIRELGRRLSGVVRASDTVARLGGDEFAIVQTAIASPADTEIMCLRIIEAIDEAFDVVGVKVQVGISIGVAFAPLHGVERIELSRKADIALYQSKAQGRGRFTIFAEEMGSTIRVRRGLERDMRGAIDRGQFAVHYQPLVTAADGTLTGVEARLRWMHPQEGVVQPETFVPIAEECGLIGPIGEWLLREACTRARDWPVATLAVDVSVMQLRKRRFAGQVCAILAETGFAPARLQLEIAESRFIDHASACQANIAALRAAGVRVALDGFGKGFTAIGPAGRFALDRVKIDRSFVQAIDAGEGGAPMIRAIVGLARATGVRVSAEGVETPEQRGHLAGLGCDELQGALTGRALSADEMEWLVAPERDGMPGRRGFSLGATPG
ncbi:putative bifunctional diguanylate cyclase/phosphodiesterase [Sphingomonas profundi]|uniref:putative bifunctional diguanylate cyclase/phosphodiesterase n=1 Tax=Alterirhizorhabdus profundi TaxID=2681549 RepID=UPI0012E8410A|nr:EAL domain-containing protein [Sphingomonas profundi]